MALSLLAAQVAPGALARERSLPVHPALEGLLPQGLIRGSTVACTGAAARSNAVLMAAGASAAGSWVGVAGLGDLGAQAAAEAGLDLQRVVMVRGPRDGTRWDDGTWGQVLAALVDGFDVVLVGADAAARLRGGTARRVQARLQARGGVLVVVGDAGAFSPDLRVSGRCRWHGLGEGHGHLRAREVELVVEGRRVPRARRETLWFPDTAGRITPRLVAAPAAAEPGELERAG